MFYRERKKSGWEFIRMENNLNWKIMLGIKSRITERISVWELEAEMQFRILD